MRKAVVAVALCVLIGALSFLAAVPHDSFEFQGTVDTMYLSSDAERFFTDKSAALSGVGSVYSGALVETFSFDLSPGEYTFSFYGGTDVNTAAYLQLFSPKYVGEDNSSGRVFAEVRLESSGRTVLTFENEEMIRGARLRVARNGPGEIAMTVITASGNDVYNDAAAISVLAVLVTAAALLLLHRRRHELENSDYGSVAVMLCCALAAVISTAPMLRLALLNGHDIIFHLTRIEGVAESLRSGQFPMRINPTFLYGYGYADGIMYPPTFLYFPAILRLLGVSTTVAFQIFMLTINSLTAAVAYASFKRLFRRRDIALFAAVAYTLCLYRLICVFTRAAVGELLAMAFLPAVLLGMYETFFGDERRGMRWLIFGFTALINCHVLTVEITAIFCIIFTLASFASLQERARLISLLKAAGTVIVLNLWILIPMLDIGTSGLIVSHYTPDADSHAVYPAEMFATSIKALGLSGDLNVPYTAMPLSVGGVLGLGMLVFVFGKFFVKTQVQDAERLDHLGTGAMKLGLIALFIASTLFPWAFVKDIPGLGGVLASVQFPWRYFSAASVLLVVVLTAGVSKLVGEMKQRRLVLFLCALAVALCASPYIDHYMQDSGQTAVLANKYSPLPVYYIGGQEYLRYTTSKTALDARGPAIETNGAEISQVSKRYLKTEFTYSGASGDASAWAELPLYYYNGYRARDDKGNALTVSEGTTGVVRVALPDAEGTVTVWYAEPVVYRVCEALSLAAAIFVITLEVRRRKRVMRIQKGTDNG